MSEYYDATLTLFLAPDTPESVIEELRWHMGEREAEPEGHSLEESYRVIPRASHSYLPGGDRAVLVRQSLGEGTDGPQEAWGLALHHLWHEDSFLSDWSELLEWLAPHVLSRGHVGLVREEFSDQCTLLYFQDGAFWSKRPGQERRRQPF